MGLKVVKGPAGENGSACIGVNRTAVCRAWVGQARHVQSLYANQVCFTNSGVWKRASERQERQMKSHMVHQAAGLRSWAARLCVAASFEAG